MGDMRLSKNLYANACAIQEKICLYPFSQEEGKKNDIQHREHMTNAMLTTKEA